MNDTYRFIPFHVSISIVSDSQSWLGHWGNGQGIEPLPLYFNAPWYNIAIVRKAMSISSTCPIAASRQLDKYDMAAYFYRLEESS